MNRRTILKTLFSLAMGLLVSGKRAFSWRRFHADLNEKLKRKSFGEHFKWGTATAAFQIEGAYNKDGKSPSIWDNFTLTHRKFRDKENATVAADFYHRYPTDIDALKQMNFNNSRFSLAWTRILPQGSGMVNQAGIDHYHRVIDHCLENGIEPWITLYHWDLPQVIEEKGGWTNREVLNHFSEFCDVATRNFGDKVKHWMVLNEPMSFTGLGYFMGYHAPGRRGVRNFLPAMHHANLAQALGAGIIRQNIPDAQIGTTFSCSLVEPVNDNEIHVKAAERLDAVLNRLFLEPVLGLGYPYDTLPALKLVEKYFQDGDEQNMAFDFDFIGLQYYFRVMAKFSLFPPILNAREIPARKREVPVNTMGMEVYPEGIYPMIKKFADYEQTKSIIITESGVCFHDKLVEGRIRDLGRIDYFERTLKSVLKAKNEGAPVNGYFVWSLMDNYEWSEAFDPRFGLVYVDFATQQRYLKDSGYWFKEFLSNR